MFAWPWHWDWYSNLTQIWSDLSTCQNEVNRSNDVKGKMWKERETQTHAHTYTNTHTDTHTRAYTQTHTHMRKTFSNLLLQDVIISMYISWWSMFLYSKVLPATFTQWLTLLPYICILSTYGWLVNSGLHLRFTEILFGSTEFDVELSMFCVNLIQPLKRIVQQLEQLI